MAKKRPAESYADLNIVFEYEQELWQLLRLDPNSMNVVLRATESGKERTLPFAHLPKSVKKMIRPL
ncbi:hypothetical protein WCX18_11990 [Sulfurimonas sp. HSL1-2]|uniref:hypothetical protein n=1 Tax=Thiomicrolovo zhangzhouensis TaxID=3131933 RepID=UPI0031F898C4